MLQQLDDVRWSAMSRTYGSSHSTLIGLLIEWWVSRGPEHSALESGPTCGPSESVVPGKRGGQCDAILMRKDLSIGVLEVEGTRDDYTFDKLKQFFRSSLADLQTLEFAIFLGYAYEPKGRGAQRVVAVLPIEKWTARACEITRDSSREIAVVALEKTLDVCKSGPRARNDYYQCKTSRIHGTLVREGRQIDQKTFWDSRGAALPTESPPR